MGSQTSLLTGLAGLCDKRKLKSATAMQYVKQVPGRTTNHFLRSRQ